MSQPESKSVPLHQSASSNVNTSSVAVTRPINGYPGMRSTHVGSSYIIGTARAAGSLSDLGIAVDTV